MQNSVELRRRATATALLFFFLNLIALGGGRPHRLADRPPGPVPPEPSGAPPASSRASSGAFGDPGFQSFATTCPGGSAQGFTPRTGQGLRRGHGSLDQQADDIGPALLGRLGRRPLRPWPRSGC
ncbi:hypothetical protein ACRAWD_25690 [Caulobacter segnis]